MPAHAHLLAQACFGASRKIELTKARVLIGRAPGSDILIDEPGLPAVMGLLVHSGGEHYAVAHSDHRPFLINGETLARKKLCDGDILMFDEFELVFSPAAPLAALRESPFPSAESNSWSLFRPPGVAEPIPLLAAPPPNSMAPPSAPRGSPPSPGSLPLAESAAAEPPAPARAWNGTAWGKLIAMHGSTSFDIELTASLCVLDLAAGKATLSRRQGQCYATLVSGVVFCSREKLGAKPKQLLDNDLIASGGSVYLLLLAAPPHPG